MNDGSGEIHSMPQNDRPSIDQSSPTFQSALSQLKSMKFMAISVS